MAGSWPALPSFSFLAAMNLAYSAMKTLPGSAQVEVLRVVAEELAVDARPDQAAVGVDVDLGDAQLGGALELVVIHALGALQLRRRRR